MNTFAPDNFTSLCDTLSAKDEDLATIVRLHGYPPMWNRPNTFETLVHIILEQQVSLASALAALNKLRDYIKEITPAKVLALTDAEFKSCFFSRQKTTYVKLLAGEIVNGHLDLSALENLSDDEVRKRLLALKGIGNWTIDIYLIFVLQRADVFPIGDLAAVNALKRVKKFPKETSREVILKISEKWKPYRSLATMLLWHYYLSSPTKKTAIKPS